MNGIRPLSFGAFRVNPLGKTWQPTFHIDGYWYERRDRAFYLRAVKWNCNIQARRECFISMNIDMNDSGPAHLPKRHIIANSNDSLHFISMNIDINSMRPLAFGAFRVNPLGKTWQPTFHIDGYRYERYASSRLRCVSCKSVRENLTAYISYRWISIWSCLGSNHLAERHKECE